MVNPHSGASSSGHAALSGGDLRQSLLKARIAKLPHLPALAPHSLPKRGDVTNTTLSDEAAGDEESEASDSVGSLSMLLPTPSSARAATSRNRRPDGSEPDDDFSPLSADDCFQEALEVEIDVCTSPAEMRASQNETKQQRRATFRVYYTPPSPRPGRQGSKQAVALRHPVSLDALASERCDESCDHVDEEDDEEGTADTIFVLHHGAGYSALSFALVAKSIVRQTKGKVGVLAYDCRGHGKTSFPSEQMAQDLSLANLTRDGMAILSKLFPSHEKQPTLVMVGHSMGGAVVVSMAHALAASSATASHERAGVPRVAGVAVLDVVEGTAMAALPSMKTIVSQLPLGFDSLVNAVRWHVDSGTIVNAQSARRSVPSLLKPNPQYSSSETQDDSTQLLQDEHVEELSAIASQAEPIPGQVVSPRLASSYAFVWRHDLLSTEPHWQGWFNGLSQSFLACKCARLLLLAGTDRLDKDLMIGQMQGKYQLVVFPDVGHSLQEDAPQRTAQTLVDFWQRNESVNISAVKGLRKVGQS